jgi:predicted N-acetyltransferase YhbS
MTAQVRPCTGPDDFPAMSDFLYSLYKPNNSDGNWFQPVWEYAYPYSTSGSPVSCIGIWEEACVIVGICQYENEPGETFFQVAPGYEYLKSEMLEYAEQHLVGTGKDGNRYLKAFVNDFDTDVEDIARSRGFVLDPKSPRPMSQYVIPDPFPTISVPDGFVLKSLDDDNDFVKLDRVLWRGFDHPGEPPADSLEGRKQMQAGPHYRKDLAIVVEAPNGDFASFAGLWYDPVNTLGYVEPVATDPDYRRMGLATAAVLEGIRRCGELGATEAYVISDQSVYLSMGFEKIYTSNAWIKYFTEE